jgi:hypothetical protein
MFQPNLAIRRACIGGNTSRILDQSSVCDNGQKGETRTGERGEVERVFFPRLSVKGKVNAVEVVMKQANCTMHIESEGR